MKIMAFIKFVSKIAPMEYSTLEGRKFVDLIFTKQPFAHNIYGTFEYGVMRPEFLSIGVFHLSQIQSKDIHYTFILMIF